MKAADMSERLMSWQRENLVKLAVDLMQSNELLMAELATMRTLLAGLTQNGHQKTLYGQEAA